MISSFRGEHAFLSNFYQCPFLVPVFGQVPDVEHPFQAAKGTCRADMEHVLAAPTAAEAKKRGREITCRTDWDEVKRRFMLSFVLGKFAHNDHLRQLLAATGDEELAEGNSWGDDYWGMISADGVWTGQNYLGKILMSVRMVLC